MKYLQFGQEHNPNLRLVFFHGYGASAQDLSDLRHLKSLAQSQWIFPEGPLESTLAPGGRAWFSLELCEPHMTPTTQGQIQESPESLYELNQNITKIEAFLAPFASDNLILGGFSQGAVMALHVALRMKKAPLALVFLSGAFFPARLLEEKKPDFCQSGRFFQSHGQKDPLLSFSEAQKTTAFLLSLNWKGSLTHFEGGHEIPSAILSQLQEFLAKLAPSYTNDS